MCTPPCPHSPLLILEFLHEKTLMSYIQRSRVHFKIESPSHQYTVNSSLQVWESTKNEPQRRFFYFALIITALVASQTLEMY